MPKKNKKVTLDSGIQTNQIWTNYDEVCIPRLSSIHLAVFTDTYNSDNPFGDNFQLIQCSMVT